MAYKTDGSVHHGGIANELETIATLNQLGLYAEQVEHRGGTQQKADAVAGDRGISIKRKQGTKVGSFDWVNTTKMPNGLAARFDGFRALVQQLKQLSPEQRADEVEDTRAAFNRCSAAAFDSITTNELRCFLRDTFAKQTGFDIVVTDTKAGELYHFAAEAHPIHQLLAKGYAPVFSEATREGQTSRTILFVGSEGTIDIGLRLRLTSNNGIGAFLGLSKSNASSSVVLKLQQDNVAGLLQSVGAQRFTV